MAYGRVVVLGDTVGLGDQTTSAGLDLGVSLYNAQRVDIGHRISLMRATSAPAYGRNSVPSTSWLHATAPRRGDDRDCRVTRISSRGLRWGPESRDAGERPRLSRR
jgi:hypothetical protein